MHVAATCDIIVVVTIKYVSSGVNLYLVSTKKTKRGRPRSFDTAKATHVAMHLFGKKGYEGVGIAELSDAMGVNPPSLYSAFGSKRELFERAAMLYAKEEGRFVREALSHESDPIGAVEKLLTTACQVYVNGHISLGCMVTEAARTCSDDALKKFLRELRLETRKAIRERLSPFPHEKAEALSDYVVFLLAGLSSQARDGESLEALLSAAAIGYRGFVDFLKN